MATAAEKIKALIAKALSTENEFPEEARTCALNAVRLIEKYKTGLNDVTPDWSPPPDARVLRLEQELHATQVRLGLVLEEKQRLVVRMSDLQSTLDHTLKRILELETEKRQAKPAKKKAATKGGKYRRRGSEEVTFWYKGSPTTDLDDKYYDLSKTGFFREVSSKSELKKRLASISGSTGLPLGTVLKIEKLYHMKRGYEPGAPFKHGDLVEVELIQLVEHSAWHDPKTGKAKPAKWIVVERRSRKSSVEPWTTKSSSERQEKSITADDIIRGAVSFDVEDVDEDPGRTIVARYPSFCGQCRRSIQPGDHMWWRPNGKNLCSDCW